MLKSKRILTLLLVISCVFSQISIPTFAAASVRTTQDKWVSTENGYDVIFQVESKWEGHFNGKITIKNTGKNIIHNWNLYFQSTFNIENIWNANIICKGDAGYVINNAKWNQDIHPGQSRDFGFTASHTGNIVCPTNFKMINYLSDVRDDMYKVDYKTNSDWGSGFTGEIIITNISDETIEDWQLHFKTDRDIQYFWSAKLITNEDNQYHIINQDFNANISPGESLSIGIMGSGGNKENEPTKFRLRQVSYKNFFSADTDNDGLTNELELQIGSDYDNIDTDHDGLPDGYEYCELETNPCKKDTDGNGINDSDEDFDQDGLTNLEEYQNGTEPFEPDTDEDDLSDYSEIKEHKTDPLKYDTDGDGLNDGDDVSLGYSPLKKDTDENNINDPDEIKAQTLTIEIDDEDKKEVDSVSVSLSTSDHIKNVVSIDNIYQVDMLASEIVGLVGVPVEITSTHEFDEATITFHYDESQLNGISEDDLSILWYDEENDWFEILDDSIVNKSNNTVSIKTTHFSKYMLVSASKWFEAWSQELDYRGAHAYFDIAYAIDNSGSMSSSNRYKTAKKAILSFVEEQNSKDRAAVISFGGSASVIENIGATKSTIKTAVRNLAISNEHGTDIQGGIEKSVSQLLRGRNRNKMVLLISDGSVTFKEEVAKQAKDNSIRIFTVNVGRSDNGANLQKYSDATGGEYYFCPNTSQIETVFANIQNTSLDTIDKTDKDNDGVYDVYEKSGIQISNGTIIKTDTRKKDTDGDGLTDGEEMGIAYQTNKLPKYITKKIGRGTTKRVRYFQLYSNPKKKDTDNDGLTDDKDSFPWHGYCGGRHPEVAFYHKYELQESGYYKCKTCGYQIKSPEMQDNDILTKEDKQKMIALLETLSYYSIKRYRINKTENLCKNEKLLFNAMRKIRRQEKYTGKYAYSSLKGKCKSKRYDVDGHVSISVGEVNWSDVAFYSGAVYDTMGVISGAICPEFSIVWTLISVGTQYDQIATIEAADPYLTTCSGLVFDKLREKSEKKLAKITYRLLSDLVTVRSIFGIVEDVTSSKIQTGDTKIRVCIDRKPGGWKQHDIQQSWAEFVFHDCQLLTASLGGNYGGKDIEE